MSDKLKFEGFAVGDEIRAYDFQPGMPDRPDRYIEGEIIEVCRDGSSDAPFAHYRVRVERDTLFEPGGRTIVLVPMETSMDFDGRVVEALAIPSFMQRDWEQRRKFRRTA